MKNTQIKKLVLGTAQFGNTRYGAGSKKKISKKDISNTKFSLEIRN